MASMEVFGTSESQLDLSQALRQMRHALDILDELETPADIASHLDLAICRLEQSMGLGTQAPTNVQILISQVERELLNSSSSVGAKANPWGLEPV